MEGHVVVDHVRIAFEGGFAAAAREAEVALQVAVTDFAPDVLIRVIADVAAERGAVLKARRRGARRSGHADMVEETSATQASELPLLGEGGRGSGGHHENNSRHHCNTPLRF